MGQLLRLLVLGLIVATGAIPDVRAQSPAPPTLEGRVYSVTYIEVMPSAAAEGLALLQRYRAATRRQDGNLRSEVVQRIGQRHQFVVLEIWNDQKTVEAHGREPSTTDTRERIAAIRSAPTDERIHGALSIGPIAAAPGRNAVYVVTHVDVIPPRKDDGVVALKRLGEGGRTANGNVRFEVVQQASRPNHFTVVEIWRDAKAMEAHSVAAATREFRDALATMTGALYDERMYRLVD